MEPTGIGIYIVIIVASIIGLWIIFYFIPVGLWFSALISGVRISLLQLILMRWRKVPPTVIVRAMIEAYKAGLIEIKRDELEAHYLAGGHVEKVVHALVSANKANIAVGCRAIKGTNIKPQREVCMEMHFGDQQPIWCGAGSGLFQGV